MEGNSVPQSALYAAQLNNCTFEREDAMRMILVGMVMLFAAAADAHNAPSGFAYTRYCCNGDGTSGDCQRIPSKLFVPARGDIK
jgi:hypothetical protein